MNRHVYYLASLLLALGVTGAFAQRPTRRNDFADLRQSLDGLKWESVDFEALSALERCRALTLLDHALTEIGAVATAEADLMSAYLEYHSLGREFASSDAAEIAPRRTYEEGQKTAAALLQGPMAESRYATMYQESDEGSLRATMRLHESASKRKWRQFSEPIRSLRGMSSFLRAGDKYPDYMVWSEAEFDLRQQDHEQAMAEKRAAAKSKATQTEDERISQAQELAEQRRQEEESRLAQQALYAQSAADPKVVVVNNNDGFSGWYPQRYYRRPVNPRVRHWHRNGANQVHSRQHTQQRFNNWHGTGGAKPAGGRRR